MSDTITLIKRTLNVDLTEQSVRERAWQRIHVFREIADECEADGNKKMAEVLRGICLKAVDPDNEDRLIYIAMLAGPDHTDDDDFDVSWLCD